MITFSVENTGSEAHEIEIIETDLAPADLPTNADGSFDDDGAGVDDLDDDIDLIAPGDTEELTVSLAPGSYVLLCNFVVPEGDALESHFHEGMYAAFTVE